MGQAFALERLQMRVVARLTRRRLIGLRVRQRAAGGYREILLRCLECRRVHLRLTAHRLTTNGCDGGSRAVVFEGGIAQAFVAVAEVARRSRPKVGGWLWV